MSNIDKPRLMGEDIFFNFLEIDYRSNPDEFLIDKLHKGELAGTINKGVFTDEEVESILKVVQSIPEEEKLNNYVGQSFPHDFGTVTNDGERLDNYLARLETFNHLPFDLLKNRLREFFKTIGKGYHSDTALFACNQAHTSPGNFRFLEPNKGGLFVHCGYLLQETAEFFYESVKGITREGQLSFFLMLQHPDEGGDLTIYDMLWDDVNQKDVFEQNDYVIGQNGQKILLENVKKFTVRPYPGDIVVFYGGPIWHRVEDIVGTKPRISFGGFINFSEDDKSFYHWA